VNFVKLDAIFLCGDLNILPWEPTFMLVVTLLHMADRSGKVVVIYDVECD